MKSLTAGLHAMREAMREAARIAADKVDRWIMDTHSPLADVNTDPPYQVCQWCERAWPCRDFAGAVARMTERRSER